jgi:hypothetical protein
LIHGDLFHANDGWKMITCKINEAMKDKESESLPRLLGDIGIEAQPLFPNPEAPLEVG